MLPTSTTYKEMYEGEMLMEFPPKSNGDILDPVMGNDYIYWNEEIAYEITRTHKLALDKPTVAIFIPASLLRGMNIYSPAAADFCLRRFKPYIDALNELLYNRSRPDAESGKYYLHAPDGEVLVRNAAYFREFIEKYYDDLGVRPGGGWAVRHRNDGNPPRICLCITMQVQLPLKKHKKAIQMLTRDLPDAVNDFINDFREEDLKMTLALADKQKSIRAFLKTSEYCAFIANGSVLPRSKGTELPLQNALPFKSIPEYEIEVCGVKGMGIKRGVTVITGGGYSGKSTLLDAVSAGVYDHITGDGRELVITDDSAVKISAEDGRAVSNVNISPFIKWIPGGDTSDFSTSHASGSTSQAANIMEAVNYGCTLLLIDEDKSATNFMIRDKMMKELIEKEPITPFTDRVNELYSDLGVSTILVIGGSGEYLSVADRIFMMDDFIIRDATDSAKKICVDNDIIQSAAPKARWKYKRHLYTNRFTSYPESSGTEILHISDMGFIFIGDERIDIRMLHNIASFAQSTAIGFIIRQIGLEIKGETHIDIEAAVSAKLQSLTEEGNGIESVFSSFFTTCGRILDMPRKNEVLAVINRMRKVEFGIEK